MTESSTTSGRSHPFWAVVFLLGLLPIAVLSFGGVHLWSRTVLVVIMATVGAGLALRSRYAAAPRLAWCLLIAVALCLVPLLPVTMSLRSLLHGDLADPVNQTMRLVGVELRPLALNPNGALMGWSEAVALVLLGLGVAGWSTRAGRVRTMQWGILLTGAAMVLIMIAHSLVAAESIYGSGMGAGTRDGFFGPFVNPNHGGIFCAALVPMAWGRVVDGRPGSRVTGVLLLGLFMFGVWASGSRGAVVSTIVAILVTAAAMGGSSTRKGIAGFLVFALVSVFLVGPRRVLQGLGSLVAPSVNQMVESGYVDLTTGRLGLFEDALEIITQSSLFGVGGAGFGVAHRMVKSEPVFNSTTHTHNEYLQIIAEQGWVVAAAVFAALMMVVGQGLSALDAWHKRPDRRWQIASFLGSLSALAVASTVDFPLRLLSHSILAVLCLGSLIGLARSQRGGRPLNRGSRRIVGALWFLGLVALGCSVYGNTGLWGHPEASRADGQAWMQRASQSKSKDDFLSAQAHFRRAINRGLNRTDYQWLAAAEVASGQPEAATTTLTVATELYPTMPWLWRDRARLAQRMNDPVAARTAWSRMLALDLPSRVNPVDVLHEALFGSDFETPIAQARAVLPERADRYRQAARVMDQLGLVEEAETLFRHAMSLEPGGVQYFAEALIRWNRPADAVMLLEANRVGCKGEQRYAESLLKIDRAEAAAKAFTRALSLCGAHAWNLRVGLAKSRLLSGDSRGEDVVEDLLRERPDSHGLRRVWLWVLSRRGRPVDGVRHLEHLKYSGVIQPVEEAALERARLGLPFNLPRPTAR